MIAKVNGTALYYERTGSGPPILLLHGNGESGEIFDKLVPALAKQYDVIMLDSRGQGRNVKVKQLSYAMMAADTSAFIRALGLHKPIVYGFSDGGIIGLLLAMDYPDDIGYLIASGANITPDGTTPKLRRLLKLACFFSRSPLLRLMRDEPNISPAQLAKIKIPVVVLAGENDFVTREQTELIAASIPNSTLEILPGEEHGTYIIHSEKLYPILQRHLPALDAKSE